MQTNIKALRKRYSFLNIGNMGKSVLGKDIPYVKIGNGNKEVMYSGGIHASEWITSLLMMKFVENFCKSVVNNFNIYGQSARNIFNQVSIYFLLYPTFSNAFIIISGSWFLTAPEANSTPLHTKSY